VIFTQALKKEIFGSAKRSVVANAVVVERTSVKSSKAQIVVKPAIRAKDQKVKS